MSTDQEKLFCPECGTQNLAIASFCINCGLDLRNLKRKGHDDFLLLKEHLEPLNYKLENKINEVYSGTNFLGEHIPTGRKVVIKLTNQEYSNDAAHKSFIINGAKVAQVFDHPNIHKVFSYGEIDNRPYIISDFAENGPLNWTLDYYGSNGIPIPIALNYMIQILEGLDHIHSQGYIHKDLKINNIFILKNGDPVIGGFNFSRKEDEPDLFDDRKLYGTVSYMSPERCRLSKNIDSRTDIYSAGILLYQLLAGELPFQGDTHTLLYQQTNKPLPVVTFRLIARGLNSRDKSEEKLYLYANELQTIIEKACAKSKKARFSTAKEFAQTLKHFLDFVKIPLPEKKSKNEQWKVLKGYEADQSGGKGEDRLGITGSVESFARLISSRSVQPPLSIGLFGNWGSGKSFFIGKLKKEIDKITLEMRQSIENGSREPDLPFYSRIVQIEFNAWHFVDANLWPSLVHHLFSNLKIQGESGKGLEERRKYLIQKIEAEKQGLSDLEQKEQEYINKLSSLEKEVEEEALRYSERIGNIFKQKFNSELEKAWSDEKINRFAHKMGIDISENEDISEKAKKIYETAKSEEKKTLWEKWKIKFKGYSVFLVFLSIAFIAIALCIFLFGILKASGYLEAIFSPLENPGPFWSSILSYLGAFFAIFKGGLKYAKNYFEWAPRFWDTAREIFPDVEKEINAAEVEREEKLQQLRIRKDAFQEEKLKIQDEITKLESELEKTNAGDVLKNFIMSRIGSDDYSKHLGIQSKIRDDFEKLSSFITEYNNDVNQEVHLPKEKSDHLFNRIVLYIDDLDRCPPDKVVEVLQAVHLLLSFPAFIVVVAVDSRWVSQSLRYSYRELFGDELDMDSDGDGIPDFFRATPHDYLEKIFQIPFWLYPMNMDGRRNLITKLMEISMKEEDIQEIDSSKVETNKEDINLEETPELEEEKTSSQDSKKIENTHFAAIPDKTDQLVIQKSELDFSVVISPLLGQSPRALKRFVNVYLLVKVELSDLQWQIYFEKIHPKTGLKEEKGVSRNFQAIMFLLAIITGLPATSKIFFKALRTRSVKSFHELLESIDVHKRENGWEIMGSSADEMSALKRAVYSGNYTTKENKSQYEVNKMSMQLELQIFTKWLDVNFEKRDWTITDIEQLRYWDPIVSKYSFRVEPFEQD